MPSSVTNYYPDADDAEFDAFTGPAVMSDPGSAAYAAEDATRLDVKYFGIKVINEILGLIRRVLNMNLVVAKTAAYPLVAGDTNKTFTNAGAVGSVTFTLPALTSGYRVRFYKAANQTFLIETGAIGRAKFGDLANAASYFELLTQYGTCEVWCDGTNWIVSYGPTDLA